MNRKPYVISRKNYDNNNNYASAREWVKIPVFIKSDVFMDDELRTVEDIQEYMDEAFDKVWLMRSRPTDNPDIERRRIRAIDRILNTYDDIPDDGYTDWECGYWNGILGALRWVLGDEKDFLDT